MEKRDFYVSPNLDVIENIVAENSFLQGSITEGELEGEGDDDG